MKPNSLRKLFVAMLLGLMVVLTACGSTQTGTSLITPTATVQTPDAFIQTVQARASQVAPTPTATTGSYRPFQPLLAKVVMNGPVDVTGDQSVPDAALNAANAILTDMLQHRPDIVAALRRDGTLTVVASRNESICDLPYFSGYNSSLCQKYGEGGAGGTPDHPVTACDEKNLLAEPDDPYQRGKSPYSQDICVHELAHTIMDVGLTQADRDRIEQRFLAARQEGRWGMGDYAMSNALEFWAVMSQFYFSAGPGKPYSPTFTQVANGPDALKQYDPATFALLDSIYQGSTNLQ
jgi:hypothetical protein